MQLYPLIIFIPILATIGYFDLKQNRIPNVITYPSVIAVIVLNLWLSDMPYQALISGGLACLVFGLLITHFAKQTGRGDIKFMVLLGFMFGMPWVLPVLLGGFMIAGMVLFVFKIARKLNPVEPLGVYLSSSGIVVCIWQMMWYL